MGKYKKREDGRYFTTIGTGEIDKETGKENRIPIYARTLADFESKIRDIRYNLDHGTYADDRGNTVETWSKTWFELEMCGAEIRTKEMYDRIVHKIIIPNIGGIELLKLRKTDIQKMINKYITKARTCQQIKMTLNRILESAIDESLLYKNVCRNVSIPAYIASEKRPLTDTEEHAFANCELTEKERLFVSILYYCGLRRGEILALSRSDINFNSNVITIRNVVTFNGNTAVFKNMPKTEAGKRSIPITNVLKDLLTQYIKSLDTLYLFEMERKGGLMSKSSFLKFWSKIVDKFNVYEGGNENISTIQGLTPHIFRHNYATMLFYSGVDAKEAQYLLGHSNVKLTLDIYTHLKKENNTAIDKLEQYLAQ